MKQARIAGSPSLARGWDVILPRFGGHAVQLACRLGAEPRLLIERSTAETVGARITNEQDHQHWPTRHETRRNRSVAEPLSAYR